MKTKLKLWATLNGENVYTDINGSFSVLENSLKQAEIIIKRGFPIQKGESIDLLENQILNYPNSKHTFIGTHSVYTNIKI